MNNKIKEFKDPRIISFIYDNLKYKQSFKTEDYKTYNSKNYFYHKHDKINIKKPPKTGKEKNISRDGRILNYTFGNAVSDPKHIHANYCFGLFPKKYYPDGTIIHPNENNIEFYEGMQVIARWDLFGFYYSGIITNIVDKLKADVNFKNGHKVIDVSFKNIIPIKRNKIEVDDFVMAEILNEYEKECWVPGVVQYIDYNKNPIEYHILYYNGEKGINIYIQLIKITEEEYKNINYFIINLINKKKRPALNEDYNDHSHEDFLEIYFFGKEYLKLKAEYRPILQPYENYFSADNAKNDDFLNLRKSLRELRIGEEILAKWPDDCWYYPSVVKDYLGDYKYKIQNNLRAVKIITREDLVSKIDFFEDVLKIGDTVLAAHPKFKFAYAPGEIVQLTKRQSKLIIRFYDYSESSIDKNDVYHLKKSKFQHDIKSIHNIEEKWIGQTVYSLNPHNKTYEWGKIIARLIKNRQLSIEWSNGDQTIQNAFMIFINKNEPTDNKDKNKELNQNILSDSNESEKSFKLKKKTEENLLILKELYQKSNESKWKKQQLKNENSKFRSCTLVDQDRSTPIIDANQCFSEFLF